MSSALTQIMCNSFSIHVPAPLAGIADKRERGEIIKCFRLSKFPSKIRNIVLIGMSKRHRDKLFCL